MFIFGILCIVALAVGVVLFFSMRAPKLTAKKTIVEAIVAASDELYVYRQEVRGLISDNLGVYQQHDEVALATRAKMVGRRGQGIKQKIAGVETYLAPYEKIKVQREFYDAVYAALHAVRQATHTLGELQSDSELIEPVMASIQHLSILVMDANLTAYIMDDDQTTVDRVKQHLQSTVDTFAQATNDANGLQLQTDEFHSIARSIQVALRGAMEEYINLQALLATAQYDDFRRQSQSMPSFLSRFDSSSYDSIATAFFAKNPENNYINELRAHAY